MTNIVKTLGGEMDMKRGFQRRAVEDSIQESAIVELNQENYQPLDQVDHPSGSDQDDDRKSEAKTHALESRLTMICMKKQYKIIIFSLFLADVGLSLHLF